MHRSIRIAVIAAACAALLAFAGAASASSAIFFGVFGAPRTDGTAQPLYGTALDGSGLTKVLADSQGAGKMAVQGGYLYWIAGRNPSVARMRLDGTGVDLHYVDMPADSRPSPAIAVTADAIYYSYITGTVGVSDVFHVARAPIGGGAGSEIATSPGYVQGLATAASHLIWSYSSGSGNGLARAALDGSGVDAPWIALDDNVGDVEADAAHVYVLTSAAVVRAAPAESSKITRYALDGTGATVIVRDLVRSIGLAVTGTTIYWTSNQMSGGAGATIGRIGRADLDGGNAEPSFIVLDTAKMGTPYGIAVAGDAAPDVTIRSASTMGGIGEFRVRVPGPGTITVRGSRAASTRAAARALACRSTTTVRKAGAVTVHCVPNAATRAILERGAVRVRVTITFRSRGGGTSSATRVVVFRKINPSTITG